MLEPSSSKLKLPCCKCADVCGVVPAAEGAETASGEGDHPQWAGSQHS